MNISATRYPYSVPDQRRKKLIFATKWRFCPERNWHMVSWTLQRGYILFIDDKICLILEWLICLPYNEKELD